MIRYAIEWAWTAVSDLLPAADDHTVGGSAGEVVANVLLPATGDHTAGRSAGEVCSPPPTITLSAGPLVRSVMNDLLPATGDHTAGRSAGEVCSPPPTITLSAGPLVRYSKCMTALGSVPALLASMATYC